MVIAGGDEGGALSVALGERKAKHSAVKIQRALEVGNLEMDMANANCGINRRVHALPLLADAPSG
ncbi:MAG: hypothetical protein ACRD5F_04745 [Candidatus Acidiferrales bacterium]